MTTVTNVQAFTRLMGYCTGYGGKYNPGRQNLQIEALQNKLDAVRQSLDQVKETKVHFDNEVNARRQAFSGLPALSSSIMRALEASGASLEKIADARGNARIISRHGTKSRPAIPADEANVSEAPRRVSRPSGYATKLAAFERLIETVATEPLYMPNEPELTIGQLAAKAAALHASMQSVIEARVQWSNAIVGRDAMMYGASDSLLQTSRAVRRYVRSVFGLNSPQYQQLNNAEVIKP